MKRLLTLIFALLLTLQQPVLATAIPASGYPSNAARTKGEMKQYFEDVLHILKEIPGGTTRSLLTLATDTVAIPDDCAVVHLAAQTGTADNCNTLTGNTRDGRMIFIRADVGDTITLIHAAGGSGQFNTNDGQPLVLTDKTYAVFYYNLASTRWEEVARDSLRMFGGNYRSTLTLDTNGYATPVGGMHLLDTFGGAGTDNCDRLVTTNKVQFVLVRLANTGRIVSLRHLQGGDGQLNNRDGQTITFSSLTQAVLYERNGTQYDEVGRFGFYPEYEAKASTFTAEWGHAYSVSATATANLPTAVGNNGQSITLKWTGASGTLTVDPNSTQTIDGATTKSITNQYDSVIVTSDGTNTLITSSNTQAGGIPFGGDGKLTLPTSGTWTGNYYHSGSWTSTGTITANPGTKIFITGNMTLSHAITVNTGPGGGAGANTQTGAVGHGRGYSGGTAAALATREGGGGGGNGGAGGSGGSGSGGTAVLGGAAIKIDEFFGGSGGGGGGGFGATSQGGNGGAGGGSLYFEVLGTTTLNANITADGAVGSNGTVATAGGGGGGSGGTVEGRSRGAVSGTGTIFARGGAGGNGNNTGAADGGGGGGGGGGNIRMSSASTISGITLTATGGAAGTGSSTLAATAGGVGVTTSTASAGISTRPW